MDHGKVRLIDPSVDGRWDAFVDGHPRGTIYHLARWKEVIGRTFGYAPLYWVLEDGAGGIEAALPLFLVRSILTGNRLVSVPFADHCDLLVRSDEAFDAIMGEVSRSVWGAASRLTRLYLEDSAIDVERRGFELECVYRHHILAIDRPSEAIRSAVLSGSRRTNIRVAERSGVLLSYSNKERDLRDYYHLYVLTRRRHALLPLPFAFFDNVWEQFAPPGMAYLILARWRGVTIAGIMLLRYRDTLFALSNSSMDRHLSCRPNDLLWWESIRLAERENLKFFDFGRTSPDMPDCFSSSGNGGRRNARSGTT